MVFSRFWSITTLHNQHSHPKSTSNYKSHIKPMLQCPDIWNNQKLPRSKAAFSTETKHKSSSRMSIEIIHFPRRRWHATRWWMHISEDFARRSRLERCKSQTASTSSGFRLESPETNCANCWSNSTSTRISPICYNAYCCITRIHRPRLYKINKAPVLSICTSNPKKTQRKTVAWGGGAPQPSPSSLAAQATEIFRFQGCLRGAIHRALDIAHTKHPKKRLMIYANLKTETKHLDVLFRLNVASTIVKGPAFFFGGGVCFALVNRKSLASPKASDKALKKLENLFFSHRLW